MAQIYVSHLTFCYEGSYDNIFEDVSFEIDSDWKLGFIGRNGRGKTTFLKLLLDEYKYQGTISSPMEFDYFPFEVDDPSRQTIDIVDSINSDYEFWKLCRELSLLKLDADILYQPFNSLSLGERTKVMLAVLFLRENNFLLIDEPTNHLDIRGRELVSNYLKSKKGFILVSHDKRFLDNCVDHILSINKTDIVVQKGNFSTWQENKERQDNFELMQDVKLRKDINHLEQAARQTANWSDKVEKTKIGDSHADTGRIGHLAAKMMKRSIATQTRRDRAVE
jgi:lincosamide and streptogramin A transport system ATP-binding/permease protein